MPLAPDALFVAGDRDCFSITPVLHEKFRGSLPLRVVQYQFSQAREFAIGKDEGVEKNQTLVRIAERSLPIRSSIPTAH
jgi:hypothetical protein